MQATAHTIRARLIQNGLLVPATPVKTLQVSRQALMARRREACLKTATDRAMDVLKAAMRRH